MGTIEFLVISAVLIVTVIFIIIDIVEASKQIENYRINKTINEDGVFLYEVQALDMTMYGEIKWHTVKAFGKYEDAENYLKQISDGKA